MTVDSDTSSRFARFTLSSHGRDEGVAPGRWEPCTCVESEDAIEAVGGWAAVGPLSSLTDLDGDFGDPMIFTEWGSLTDYQPVSATVIPYPRGNGCFHLRYVREVDQ